MKENQSIVGEKMKIHFFSTDAKDKTYKVYMTVEICQSVIVFSIVY